MKKPIILSLIALLALSVNSCTKRMCCVTGPMDSYVFAARKGSQEWMSKKTEVSIINDSLHISGSAGQEQLHLRIKFNGIGKYSLKPEEMNFVVTNNGDVTVVAYQGDNSAESTLNINTYDKETKVISGNFSFNMTRTPRYAQNGNGYPEKLTFTDGALRTKLID